MPSLATSRGLRRPRLGSGPFAVLVGVIVVGIVAASAATIGPVWATMTSDVAAVTYAESTRRASDVALTVDGAARVTAATVTITGPDLTNLPGQAATIVLLDSAGVQVASSTAPLDAAASLVVGASTATFRLNFTTPPLRTETAQWAVIVAGESLLGPSLDTPARTVTTGQGVFSVVPSLVLWQQQLIPVVTPTIAVTSMVMTVATIDQQCVAITITGTSSTLQPWSLELAYSAPPFYGAAPTISTNVVVSADSGGAYTIVGRQRPGNTMTYHAESNNWRLSSAQSITITACLSATATAPDRPEAYSVSEPVQSTWTDTRACLQRTVTGNGTYPFYFGWSAAFDMTTAIARITAADPAGPTGLAVSGGAVTPSTYTPGVVMYSVANLRETAVSGTGSQLVELCVTR